MLFDLDGTLADTLPVCFVAFRRSIEAFTGQRLSDEEIMARFGPSEEGILQRLVPDRWEACLRFYLELYEQEHRRRARLFPGIEAVLRRLKAGGLALGIVTGKGAQSAAISLRDLGLDGLFDAVETGVPGGSIKPVAIRRVLARWNMTPARAAYVGDAPGDIQAARAVGLLSLAVAWDTCSSVEALAEAAPHALFTRVEEFRRWIEANLERRLNRRQRNPAGAKPAAGPPPEKDRSR